MSDGIIKWSDLGSPTEPGTYPVKGRGVVEVSQDDVDEATALGGDPSVEIAESTAFHDSTKTFILGHFIP